jgi:hypothetical protein
VNAVIGLKREPEGRETREVRPLEVVGGYWEGWFGMI